MKICGIYVIENSINHKKYIGQSIDILGRMKSHFYLLSKNSHYNLRLQSDWNKHEEINFEFYMIRECSLDELDEKEVYYISLYNSKKEGYNQIDGGKTYKSRTTKGKCLLCGKKTRNLYSKYCNRHKYKCQTCHTRHNNLVEEENIVFIKGEMYISTEKRIKCPVCSLEKAKKIHYILNNGLAAWLSHSETENTPL